ncbi:hypothetical protein I4U23_000745 [Adineta vaga]|nr:hypothetical protein I4U23_000745 [Adineta vaga]
MSRFSTVADVRNRNNFQRYECNTNINTRNYVSSQLPTLPMPCHDLRLSVSDPVQSPKLLSTSTSRSSTRTILSNRRDSEQEKNMKMTNVNTQRSLIRSVSYCPTSSQRDIFDEHMALFADSFSVVRISLLASNGSNQSPNLCKNSNHDQKTCKRMKRNHKRVERQRNEHVEELSSSLNDISQSTITVDQDYDYVKTTSLVEDLPYIPTTTIRKQLHVYLPKITR